MSHPRPACQVGLNYRLNYVCNNRYNHKSCKQEYIRADILEGSVIQEIGKLAERRDVVSALVRDFTDHNRTRRLPELETRRQAVRKELEGVRGEKEKLSRWLRGADLTAQAIVFLNHQVDKMSEQESQVQERLWVVEDEINTVQTITYNAQEICDQLAEFVRAFPDLTDGERKLLVDSLIAEVVVKHKEVAVILTPPLAGFGFLSTELAPRNLKVLCKLLLILADIWRYFKRNLQTLAGSCSQLAAELLTILLTGFSRLQ